MQYIQIAKIGNNKTKQNIKQYELIVNNYNNKDNNKNNNKNN